MHIKKHEISIKHNLYNYVEIEKEKTFYDSYVHFKYVRNLV